MTSLEDRFWLMVICAVHQTRWSVARLFSGVSLRICPCLLLLAHGWPEAHRASGTLASSSQTVGTAESLTDASSSLSRWRLLRMLFVRAGCCTPLLYGLTVRLSLVSLDQPQSTCRQRCLKRGQVPSANIENVRLAADANPDCGGGMAGGLVWSKIPSRLHT